MAKKIINSESGNVHFVVVFTRRISDEMDVLEHRGLDLTVENMVQQLRLELQEARDCGHLAGMFEITTVIDNSVHVLKEKSDG